VAQGEARVEVETDKAVMEVEAYTGGFFREALVQEGEMASAMAPLCILTDDPQEAYDQPPLLPAGSEAPGPAAMAEPVAPEAAPKHVLAVPAARWLAKELGIDLGQVTGTGPGGLITRHDVEQVADGTASATAPAFKALAAMANLTTASKSTIPHFYVTVEVDMAAAETWRTNWNQVHPDLPASVNDVFVRSASRALWESPALQLSYRNGQYERRATADVLLVVSTPAGLQLVPIANPQGLPWEEYLRTMHRLLAQVKEGRTRPAPATPLPLVALSNLGMHGVKEFTAIIPPGCTVALAVGCLRQEVVVREGQMQIGRVCSLTLSCDHRVVDGEAAAHYLFNLQRQLFAL
jgi:pyruvate dehydrogenase E2 component (dihydrolipoamide acetyltransferase)